MSTPRDCRFADCTPSSVTRRLCSIAPALVTRKVTSPAGAAKSPSMANSVSWTSSVVAAGGAPPPESSLNSATTATATTPSINAVSSPAIARNNIELDADDPLRGGGVAEAGGEESSSVI